MTTHAQPATPALPVIYWDDLQEGMEDTSPARTILESDLIAFAGLSGDYNPIHTDRVFCAEHGLGGERLVYGLLGAAIVTGLFSRCALGVGLQGRIIALLDFNITFTAPLRVGDTVHVKTRVIGSRPTSNPERGIVELQRRLVNQDGVLVQETVSKQLLRRRPASEGDA
jgi:3-hydroxybutyryl-CoA dehydratase